MKEINLNTKIAVYPLEECSEVEKKLIDRAKQATLGSYAPYSNFRVGAAVLLGNGEIIAGNNQENAAYPSGLCAERTTVFFAHAAYPRSENHGYRRGGMEQWHVHEQRHHPLRSL
jgi:cytidine deaminase